MNLKYWRSWFTMSQPRTYLMEVLQKNPHHLRRQTNTTSCVGFIFCLVTIVCSAPHLVAQQKDSPSTKYVEAVIETTKGNIRIRLFAQKAPTTVKNFLHYVDSGCYEGAQFFRTVRMDNQPDSKIKIEVIQASANRKHREKFKKAIPLERTKKTGLAHVDGVLSMGRAKPDSATHHFFICIGDQPELDFGGKRNPDGQGFAAFGIVTKGMDVVKKIQAGKDTNQQLNEPVKIKNIRRLK